MYSIYYITAFPILANGPDTISFVKGRGKLHLTNLDESAEKALCDAKKRFEDARKEATKAFNNAVLTDFDRILALAIRLTATILENIENPADSSAACRSGLGELHSTPFVQENFKVELTGGFRGMLNSDERRQIILWVYQVNHIIHDVFEGEIGILFNWPFIEIENERVDPLRDSRVGKALSKLEMGDCSVTWSIATSIISVATNSRGQFIVIDTYDRCAVLDPTGTFLYSFGLPAEENRIVQGMIRAVATDNDDNIYLCVKNRRNESFVCDIYVFKNHARENCSYRFFVQYNFEAVGVMVVGDHVIVPGRELTSPSPNRFQPNDYIMVYKRNGTPVGHISAPELKCIQGITAVYDSRIMVLDKSSFVFVFAKVTGDCGFDHLQNPLASYLLQWFLVTCKACAIAFHPATEHVIIVSRTTEERTQVLLYSKNGDFERGIDIALKKEDLIRAAVMTADGRICVATKSKVLVL